MGDLHFYYHKQYRNIIPFFGVNALKWATSISTDNHFIKTVSSFYVSMP